MFGTVAIIKPKAGQEQALVGKLNDWWDGRSSSTARSTIVQTPRTRRRTSGTRRFAPCWRRILAGWTGKSSPANTYSASKARGG